MRPFSETQRRADEATGLSGEDLENFHKALMAGVAQYGSIRNVDRADVVDEIRARWSIVAEELLGPERAQTYMDELFAPDPERGERYVDAIEKGKGPVEAARAAGYDVKDEPDAAVGAR